MTDQVICSGCCKIITVEKSIKCCGFNFCIPLVTDTEAEIILINCIGTHMITHYEKLSCCDKKSEFPDKIIFCDYCREDVHAQCIYPEKTSRGENVCFRCVFKHFPLQKKCTHLKCDQVLKVWFSIIEDKPNVADFVLKHNLCDLCTLPYCHNHRVSCPCCLKSICDICKASHKKKRKIR